MAETPNNGDLLRFSQVAELAAREAGQFLLTRMGQVSVKEKNPGDFVTQADIESQRLIQDHIESSFPDHGFLGEEDTSGRKTAEELDFCWIVDPIDGTTNFIHQLPSFSVSIALRFRQDIVVGCVYDPILDEMFSASRGQGALLNGAPIQTSSAVSTKRSIVVCSLPRGLNRQSVELIQLINVLCDSQATVRRLGSAALNMCYIACGRIDAYWSTLAEVWDIAAGEVILAEAGGVIGAIDGGDLDWNQLRFVAAATPELRQELVKVLST